MVDAQPDHEYEKWKYEQNRAVAERSHDVETEFGHRANEAAVNSGTQAVRAAIIINGGAAVTMLAFIGHLISVNEGKFVNKFADLTDPLIWFAWGVTFAAMSVGGAYFTNYAIATASVARSRHYDDPFIRETNASKAWKVAIWIFQIVSVGTCIASITLFVIGMLDIQEVISTLKQPVSTSN
jgi:hypothetical protein